VGLTFFCALSCFFSIGLGGDSVAIKLGDWITCGLFEINWGFLFDPLSISVICVVTGVSSLVHMYSIGYMSEDPHRPRFMCYLSLFTFFMVILVTADNLVQMFLGWEGIGLTSYLLIGFWYTRIQANKAAIKAMLVNRVGDLGLALGIAAAYAQYNCLDYATLFAVAPTANDSMIFFG
jgi:NADH:ubiquinone oxidoreductase subunit 5 (subunit L)/multisubunit Na+/H+ antiporter MnhA subunit